MYQTLELKALVIPALVTPTLNFHFFGDTITMLMGYHDGKEALAWM